MIASKILRRVLVMILACAALRLGAQPFTVLHTFGEDGEDGASSTTGLLLSGSRLYGGTSSGDTNGGIYELGTMYSLDVSGSNYTVLFTFHGTNGQGVSTTPLMVNGVLYGTTLNGGPGYPNAGGVLFKMNTNGGGFSLLHAFNRDVDGQHPDSLQQESSNVLCGAIQQTEYYYYGGLIFECALNFNNLISYSPTFTNTPGYYSDGSILSGALAFSNGAVYGTTQSGGQDQYYGGGTVYSKNGGTLTVLHSFSTATAALRDQGYYPYGGVVLVGNKLYGTTRFGGPADGGVIFSVDLTFNQYTPLRAFTNAPDGAAPVGPLLASGNTLYGTTSTGGTENGGTIFAINLDGTGYKVLYNFGTLPDPYFDNDDGVNPQGTLLLYNNALYGTCYSGGANDNGTIWKLALPPPVNLPQLATTHSGTKLVLTWPTNFTGFTLQSNTNLGSTNWSTVSPPPVQVNGQYTVTNAISGTRLWYRLRQ